MKFHPTKDYLLAKPLAIQETKTQGGVIVPGKGHLQQAQPASTPSMVFAEVLEAGPEAQPVYSDKALSGFSVGDVIAFHPGACQIIGDGVNEALLVKATAVVATIEDFSENVTVKLA